MRRAGGCARQETSSVVATREGLLISKVCVISGQLSCQEEPMWSDVVVSTYEEAETVAVQGKED